MRNHVLVPLVVACSASFAATDLALEETARRTSLPQDRVAKSLENCHLSQSDMNTCAGYRFVREELELNRFYRELLSRREERDPRKLRKAQEAWLRWRDANCEYEASDLQGGSLQPLITLNCKARVTKERTEWVREMLSCTSVRGACRSQGDSK